VIQITHFDGKGASGYEGTTFQVRKTTYNLDKFIAKLQLLDYSNFAGAACILGDGTVLPQLYINATAIQKEKWCFACDWFTKQFSNGDPGKGLYD